MKNVTALFEDLLSQQDVTQVTSLRRSNPLFQQGEAADAIYFIEAGLIKLTRSNADGGRFILSVCGPGDLIGEEALSAGLSSYHSTAEVLNSATLRRVSRETVKRIELARPELTAAFAEYLVKAQLKMANKVELLCLRNVEYRMLYYLEELTKLVQPEADGESCGLPMTQWELADLIGATRETTSTALNLLEKKGLVKLSRRLLTVSSPATLRANGNARAAAAAVTGS